MVRLLLLVFPVLPFFVALSSAIFVSNLDVACLKCICQASTGCDERYDCSPQGFCGPFFISRKYWEEGGSLTLDPRYYSNTGDGGHISCVKDVSCAGRVVAEYMGKHGRDCNNDGVTDCDDYARIHFYGGSRCGNPIESTAYYDRYAACRPPKPSQDGSLLR